MSRSARVYGHKRYPIVPRRKTSSGKSGFKQAIAIKPDDASVYCFMGNVYSKMKRYSEAIAAYKQAIAIKPDDAEVYYTMALTYAVMERYPDAAAAYQNVIRIDPHGRYAAKAAREMERLSRLPR